MVTWSCLGFPFALVRTSTYCHYSLVKFDSKLTFENHVCLIISRVSQRIGVLRLMKRVLWTPLCCFIATMHSFSQSLSIALRCGGLLLNVIFSYSNTRCTQWPGFAQIRLSSCCVTDVMLLHCVCCWRLIWTWIIVCSVSFHLLLSDFDIPQAAAAAHPFEFEVSSVERPNLQGFPSGPDSCVEYPSIHCVWHWNLRWD